MRRTAFTLVELLIAIAVIAVLAALIIGSIGLVREQTRRTVCLSNLRQWGMSLGGWSMDNSGRFPSSFIDVSFPRACPHVWAIADQTDPSCATLQGQQMTITTIAPYMDTGVQVLVEIKAAAVTAKASGTNRTTSNLETISGMNTWRCPSQRSANNLDVLGSSQYSPKYSDFMVGMGYSYFARADFWKKYTTQMGFPKIHLAPAWVDQVCGAIPESHQVLMNDTLFSWMPGNFNGPNHTKNRGSKANRGNVTDMAGNNTLYGDGHASWKPVAQFNLPAMIVADFVTAACVHPQGHVQSFDWF